MAFTRLRASGAQGTHQPHCTWGRRGIHLATAGAAVTFGLMATSCEEAPVDATPEGVVEEFVDRMLRVHGDPKRARAAYDLLWSEAKQNLAERAKRASAVAGRPVGPEEMIAPSWFTTHFEPRRFDARLQGGWAIVSVSGDSPGEKRQIRCVQEEGHWRVAVPLPRVEPIERRQDTADR